MTRTTALIAEDELPQREELRGLLSQLWPDLEIVAECGDGLAALEAIESLRPDVVLLDIRMRPRSSACGCTDCAGHQGIKWITANVGNTVRLYPVDDVLFFQSQEKYTRVVTARDEALIRAPLKDLIAALDAETFWQVHRSVIVRVAAIDAVERAEDGRLTLRLRGRADRLPVSSALQNRFRGM